MSRRSVPGSEGSQTSCHFVSTVLPHSRIGCDEVEPNEHGITEQANPFENVDPRHTFSKIIDNIYSRQSTAMGDMMKYERESKLKFRLYPPKNTVAYDKH